MSRGRARRPFDAVRTTLFWCHLAAGAAAGLVVLLMSATGVALAYQRQVLEWTASRNRTPGATLADRMSLDSLVALARVAAPERPIAGLMVRSDPSMPVSVTLDDRSSIFLSPVAGTFLGTDSGIRSFVSSVERVHRSIVSRGTTRSETGRAVTGAANLAFLFLILSGPVLWWPRQRSRRAFRSVLLFTPGARGKARDWNWHHVLGIWSAPWLVLIVASATFISYEWPQAMVERAFGHEPVGAREPARGERARPELARPPREPGTAVATAGLEATASLDTVWARVVEETPRWHAIQLRLPTEAARPITATISETDAFRPDQRITVTLNAATGAVIERRGYTSLDPANRFRAWMRPLHTGEVAGLPGQTLALIVTTATLVMVWTGLALSWRRWRAARDRRKVAITSPQRSVPTEIER